LSNLHVNKYGFFYRTTPSQRFKNAIPLCRPSVKTLLRSYGKTAKTFCFTNVYQKVYAYATRHALRDKNWLVKQTQNQGINIIINNNQLQLQTRRFIISSSSI